MFSYLSPEERVRKDHPLRTVRTLTDEILREMSPVFDSMYARRGRPSIPPEKLLRGRGGPGLISPQMWVPHVPGVGDMGFSIRR